MSWASRVQKLYDFIWEEFCDWYIEMVKPRLYNEEDQTKAAALWTLKTVLIQRPKASASLYALHHRGDFLHPDPDEEASIMISAWPEYRAGVELRRRRRMQVEIIKEAVRAIRNVRTSMNVPPSKKAHVIRSIRGCRCSVRSLRTARYSSEPWAMQIRWMFRLIRPESLRMLFQQ